MKRLAILLLLGACSPAPPPAEERPEPVVVYAAFEDVEVLSESLERFTEATGVAVILRRGPAEAIVGDIIANEVLPPADLLVTRSVAGAWRAAEESALRPLYSDAVARRVPGWAADPDRLWYALAVDAAVVAYAGDEPAVSEPADLGQDRFRGGLCLSSAANEVNRATIATSIAQAAGNTRPVEIMVRRWVANLAVAPFATENELATAIADGRCDLGLMSRSVAEHQGLEYVLLPDQVANVDAVGLGRHARNPDGALRLAEWLIAQSEWPAESGAVRPNVARVAQHYDAAVLLAERARYP